MPRERPMRDEHLGILHPAAGNGAVGHDRHAVSAAGRDHLGLVEKGMDLDLVAGQRLVRDLERLLDQRDGEVGDPDVTSQPAGA